MIIMQPSWNQRLCTTTVGFQTPVRNSHSSWLIVSSGPRHLGIFLLTELELVNRFSGFFMDKIKALRSKLDVVPPSSLLSPLHKQPSLYSLSAFEAISMQVVRKSIMAVPSKSHSLDPLPMSLLKEVTDVLLPSTTSIVNCSVESVKFLCPQVH